MRLIIFIILLYSGLCYGQNEYKYLYIEQTNNEIQIKEDINVFCISKGKNCNIEQIEPNLFRINCKRGMIEVEIGNQRFLIDLNIYSNGDKFINISIYLRSDINSEDRIIFVKRGDYIKKYSACINENLCHKITIEYPKIILVNGEYKTTINPIFSKYILK